MAMVCSLFMMRVTTVCDIFIISFAMLIIPNIVLTFMASSASCVHACRCSLQCMSGCQSVRCCVHVMLKACIYNFLVKKLKIIQEVEISEIVL